MTEYITGGGHEASYERQGVRICVFVVFSKTEKSENFHLLAPPDLQRFMPDGLTLSSVSSPLLQLRDGQLRLHFYGKVEEWAEEVVE